MNVAHWFWSLLLLGSVLLSPGRTAELTRLNEKTWDAFVPQGKEVDSIYGDFVLRNDRLICVVANPVAGRNANMTVHNVGGCVIDLTRRDRQSDQLSCYYPGAGKLALRFAEAGSQSEQGDRQTTEDADQANRKGHAVFLSVKSSGGKGELPVEVTYTLQDGWDHVLVESVFSNDGQQPRKIQLTDSIRADRTFDKSPGAKQRLFWVHDKWFHQAYGVFAEPYEIDTASAGRAGLSLQFSQPGAGEATVPAGGEYRFARRLFPAADLFQLKTIAQELEGRRYPSVTVRVEDKSERPVAGAQVEVFRDKERKQSFGLGFTGPDGQVAFAAPPGKYHLRVSALGRENKPLDIDTTDVQHFEVQLVDPGYVVGHITSTTGGPIPCKVQFRGRNGAPDPSFGPDSGEDAVQNLVYSFNGQFRQAIDPGAYDVIVSYGPEYDAVFTEIEVRRGEEARLEAELRRSVRTPGWISTDFHNHSSPSGDNTSSQYGRVQNILCEQIEYAPCTEHNRISTYTPHLKRMGVEHLVGTCTGIELTGNTLLTNHQNAFPLVYKPHIQDNGAPLPDTNPEAQISRLALWDDRSEKLVQQNHPDIGWLFYDRDGDGKPDGGYKKSVPFIDCMEVHPLDGMLKPAVYKRNGRVENNRIFNWMQLLNQGYRITGVVNTDSHYNFHGSSFLRNYVQSSTDDPAKIETLNIVHAAERGHVMMTSGPFLEVSVQTNADGAAPGFTGRRHRHSLGPRASAGTRPVRNWYDIDRVQVYLNGRPEAKLNFTRAATPERFSDGVVKFDDILKFDVAGDTHVIVMAVGEKTTMGPVRGPAWGSDLPIAVSNPIFIDMDGGGFKANGDTLGAPLPVKGGTRP